MSLVKCTVLVFFITATVVYRAGFGQGTGPVFLNSVSCTGTEASLLNCSHRFGSCSHYSDAGVICPLCKLNALAHHDNLNSQMRNTNVSFPVKHHLFYQMFGATIIQESVSSNPVQIVKGFENSLHHDVVTGC